MLNGFRNLVGVGDPFDDLCCVVGGERECTSSSNGTNCIVPVRFHSRHPSGMTRNIMM